MESKADKRFRVPTPQLPDPIQAKIDGLPGVARMAIAGGSVVAVLAIAGFGLQMVGGLLSNEPKPIGQATTILEPSGAPQETEEPMDAVEAQNARAAAWEAVRGGRIELDSAIRGVTEQVRFSRAQRWQIYAAQQCQLEGPETCPSVYQWLVNAYRGKAAAIHREFLRDSRLSTDSETVNAFRLAIAELQDLSAAMALEQSGTMPKPDVFTAQLGDSIEEFFEQASTFESLRTFEAIQNYENMTGEGAAE